MGTGGQLWVTGKRSSVACPWCCGMRRSAPIGWNVVADGFHKGKLCNYAGGMIPFAQIRAERMATGDPRPSLEERYQSHEGYVEAVRAAAAHAVASKFLLQADAQALVAAAAASSVLAGD